MRGETWRCSISVCVMTIVFAARSAQGQTTQTPKWEVEIHSGGLFSTNPTGGTVGLPAPGQPFMTVPATPTTAPLPSRYEPSWYFGDGTLLFNQAAIALGQLPDQIVPLDSVLARPLGEHRGGGSVGVRVSRVLTPRVTAELSVDYGSATLRITPANREAIETTRASFIQAWSNGNRQRMLAYSTSSIVDYVTHYTPLSGWNMGCDGAAGSTYVMVYGLGDSLGASEGGRGGGWGGGGWGGGGDRGGFGGGGGFGGMRGGGFRGRR